MKLAFEVLKAQTKLEIGAHADLSREQLIALCNEVAADLNRAIEEFSPQWGELTGVIKRLETGKAR